MTTNWEKNWRKSLVWRSSRATELHDSWNAHHLTIDVTWKNSVALIFQSHLYIYWITAKGFVNSGCFQCTLLLMCSTNAAFLIILFHSDFVEFFYWLVHFFLFPEKTVKVEFQKLFWIEFDIIKLDFRRKDFALFNQRIVKKFGKNDKK